MELDGKYRTLRSYKIFNEAELTLLFRLSGGGKKGRKTSPTTTADESRPTKDVRIEEKRTELDVIMLQLKAFKHPAFMKIVDHIYQALG